jgi:serine/threonine-protein kinase
MLKSSAHETIRQLTALVELSALLNSSLDQSEVRHRAMEAVKDLLGCEASSLLLTDEKTDELYFEVALGKRGEKIKEIRLKIGEGIAGWVAKKGEPALIHDVSRDPRHTKKVDVHSKFRTRNMVCAPIKVRGKVIGVLQGINKTKGLFFKQDLGLLQMLANQVGIAIDHARLYEAIQETFFESAEANKMLGLTFQSKGMLDLALERYLKIPLDADMLEVLYHLAFDFERMRMFQKAKEVYGIISEKVPGYKDISERMSTLEDATQSTLRTSRIVLNPEKTLEPQVVLRGLEKTDKYDLVSELGWGSLGRVYKARDPRIQRLVALKILEWEEDLPVEEQTEIHRLFKKEMEIAGQLNHPGIVVIFDAGEMLERPYMAMEFLEGPSLDRWLSKGKPMPILNALHIAIQVCKALGYAHGRDTLHGGIKPSNVFVLPKNKVKITDFGVSNIASRLQITTSDERSQASTPFLSPEVILGEPLDHRSDLYSLGVLLYTLLSGQAPFRDEDPNKSMEMIIIKRPTSLRQIRSDVSVELSELLDRLMSKEPEARYEKAADLEAAMRGILRE